MKADCADDFESSIGLLIRQVLLFFGAVWVGSTLAAFGCVTGQRVGDPGRFKADDLWNLTRGPEFLLSIWLLPNLIFLSIMACRLIVCSDSTGYRTWLVLIGGEALFAMAGAREWLFHGWFALPVAWASCMGWILVTWAILYLFQLWRMRRWTGEMLALQAENEARRLEMLEDAEPASEKEEAPPAPSR
jgi:hypothetical protein